MPIEITPLTPHIAGRLTGIDARRTLTPDEVAAIEAGMDHHAVLVLPDQAIDDAQQLAFTANFGPFQDGVNQDSAQLVVGPAGLWWLRTRRDPMAGDPSQEGFDSAFVALLLLTAGTGLALLAVRTSTAMPPLLALHLGSVLALFLTMPYGKFVHGLSKRSIPKGPKGAPQCARHRVVPEFPIFLDLMAALFRLLTALLELLDEVME